MTVARFHRTSHNKKLSPVGRMTVPGAVESRHSFRYRPTPRAPFCSSTYVSIASTCSDAECPFKRDAEGQPGGCFVEAEHFTRKAMALLDAAGATAREAITEEVRAIDDAWKRDGVPQDGARGGRDLRIHVGGDTPDTEAARALADAAARWRARGGGSVWTYTHSWRRIPREAFGAIAALASCESHWQVASARRRGYAPALVVEQFPDGKRPFDAGGVRFIPCPAETLSKTCVTCRLCLDVDLHSKNLGIAFQVHGADAIAAARPAGAAAGGKGGLMEKGTRELHTLPDPTSTVPCPLRSHEHIAMGRCVEYQRDNGCHCEHALVALRRTEKHLQSPTGLLTAYDTTARADALDGVQVLIERAEAMEKARPARVPTPAAPQPTLAQTFREAQRTEIAAAVLASRATRQKPAPTPAKESIVAAGQKGAAFTASDEVVRRAFVDSGGSVNETMKRLGTTSWVATKKRIEALKLVKPATAAKPTTKAAPVPKPAAPAKPAPLKAPTRTHTVAGASRSAPPADIISLLEHQLGHHEEQAEKCRKALAVLR